MYTRSFQSGQHGGKGAGSIVNSGAQAAAIDDDFTEHAGIQLMERGMYIGIREDTGKLYLDGVAPKLRLQPFGGPFDDDLSVIDDGHTLGQVIGFFQVVGSQHDTESILT